MKEHTPDSESLRRLIETVASEATVLPEFQRDFVWEASKTLDLLDSLVRDIFIGTLIFGVPSFEITTRELDTRPRSGTGSRRRLKTSTFTEDEISKLSRTGDGFRLILDGQQRITALYRCITGVDSVFFICRPPSELRPEFESLEEVLDEFSSQESADSLSVGIADVWKMLSGDIRREAEKQHLLEASRFGTEHPDQVDELFETYLGITEALQDLFKAEKQISYYLLDTSVDKFALFFERSNSKGVWLNFIDILAAKLYAGFNLRAHCEELEDENPNLSFNRETLVRMVAFITSKGLEVKKKFILEKLTSDHFNRHWERVAQLYVATINYLVDNHWIVDQKRIPYENMLVPIMVFLDNLESKQFSQASAEQLEFLEYWFWSAVFSERYSLKTNETILADAKTLGRIAAGGKPLPADYTRTFVSQITEPEDVSDLTSPSSALFKGFLCLVHRKADGCRDWRNGTRVSSSESVDNHHIFPRGFLKDEYRGSKLDRSYTNSVANRAYIPKITNIKIGKKSPSEYLRELGDGNEKLKETLMAHQIDPRVIDGTYDRLFGEFIAERSNQLYDLVSAVTKERGGHAIAPFVSEKPAEDSTAR